MQIVSDKYIESMATPFRNRAYMRGTVGIINSDAQNNATVDNGKNQLTYFSDKKKPFVDELPNRIYATAEQNFSKLDGSMYFLPKENSGLSLYNNGLVTQSFTGSIYISFGNSEPLDIKGLTIDFGDSYPTRFSVETNATTKEYTNQKKVFVTDDVFDETTYIRIRALSMLNGQCRFRILKINFGIVDSFGNNELISCSINEFVSATSESLPSKDVEIVIDNQDSYYNPDNLESAIGYLELGQEVKLVFGYDVGDGEIEWLPEILTYLKSWNANDTQAQFVCTDLFDSMSGTYYKGKYREDGISLFNLAVDVLEDAGIDSKKCYIDTYLKNVKVQNPMPQVKHSEALQIIANAGRCAIFEDRKGKVRIQSSFKPYMDVESNGEYEYSKVKNILSAGEKISYAISSKDFTQLDDDTMVFPPNRTEDVLNVGFVSGAIANDYGTFQTNPKLIITVEAAFVAYGFRIKFRNIKPESFTVRTYNDGVQVESFNVQPTEMTYDSNKQFQLFNKMEIEFTKGYPNSRVFVDELMIKDGTNYHINRKLITESPVALRKEKLKSLTVVRNIYNKSTKSAEEILSEEVVLSAGQSEYVVYFQKPSYELSASVEENTSIKVSILESGSYYAKLKFTGVTNAITVRVKITGKEYSVENNRYTIEHNPNGADVEWNNPLISSVENATDLAEWLSSYYLGRVEYEIDWRGDPRVDANDLFYFELKDGTERMIRTYENSLTFNGAWSGKMKARAVEI